MLCTTENIPSATLRDTLAAVREALLAARTPAGHWEGELSSNALSTATAVFALSCVDSERRETTHEALIRRGLQWLADHANADGGWGDTLLSVSNISTTALCWAALAIGGEETRIRAAVANAEAWLTRHAGSLAPARLASAITARYGKDRTFSVPILTTCALAGRLGEDPWQWVTPLPFELAACPQAWFRWLRLPVVSYALPALIAIGQVRHHHRPSANPLARIARRLTRERTLRVLRDIQPTSGGFLEATPLTSFVTMSLARSGQVNHPVVEKACEFLAASVREDGSWPIDTNLATWLTTLSVNALCSDPLSPVPRGEGRGEGPDAQKRGSGDPVGSALADAVGRLRTTASAKADPTTRNSKLESSSNFELPPAQPSPLGTGERGSSDAAFPASARRAIADWLLGQQYHVRHPYTGAPPGAWAWTDLPGGVPDADDTAGALLALHNLGFYDDRTVSAARAGVQWLMDLQNHDGGMPTFCRGWGNLPFDRSGADLTAHAVAAVARWMEHLPPPQSRAAAAFLKRSLDYLAATQRIDGSWLPLWFGNQHAPDDENPTYGTARVVAALWHVPARGVRLSMQSMQAKAITWLLTHQNPDGGWGGGSDTASTIEETALAVDALSGGGIDPTSPSMKSAVCRGVAWLIAQTHAGRHFPPSPIGFYFAKLWYFEKLYPLIFTAGTLTRAAKDEVATDGHR